jgi:phosphoglycerate dehydrogenase-like enzyme
MSTEPVKILVTSAVGDESMRYLADISPRVKLTDASDLVRAELSGNDFSKAKLDAFLAEAEVIYGCFSHHPGSDLPKNLIARAPRLKWLHALSAGVDSFLDPKQAEVTSNADIAKSSVIVTNASGIHTAAMVEFIFENMLMFAKRAPTRFQWKQEKRWQEYVPAILLNKTVGILGMGYGKDVARMAKAFGMRVIALHRTAKPGERAENVDEMLTLDQLPRLLAESDYIVIMLPLTPETNRMIGEKELRTMKPTAYIINFSRGAIFDEEALIRALEEKWIAGAGLDVFVQEPLPPDNKLWELPNVIISAHVSGDFDDYYMEGTRMFAENLRCYLDGKILMNVIDKNARYQTSGPHYR